MSLQLYGRVPYGQLATGVGTYDVRDAAHERATDAVLEPGCFGDAVQSSFVRCSLGHGGACIGRTRDHTLQIIDGSRALEFMVLVRHPAMASILRTYRRIGQLHGVSPAWFSPESSGVHVRRATLIELAVIVGPRKPAFKGTRVEIVE